MSGNNATVKLKGSVALVTGGTRGIGRAITTALLDAGAKVVICGRKAPADVPATRAGAARFIPCDVRDSDAVARMFGQIAAENGQLDILVNNAGGTPPSDAASAAPRLVEKIVQLNLLAPLYCAQAANRLMQQQESGGCIINIASVSGIRPSPGTTAYGAAKAGLLSATESLAMEWGPKVRVNAIVVGLVRTEEGTEHYGGEAGMERIARLLPLRRLVEGEDVAQACLYLASPLAHRISGAKLAVHAGGEPPLFLSLAHLPG